MNATLYLPNCAGILAHASENSCAAAALLLGTTPDQVEIAWGNDGSGATAYFMSCDGTDHEHNPEGEAALEALTLELCEVSGPLLIIRD